MKIIKSLKKLNKESSSIKETNILNQNSYENRGSETFVGFQVNVTALVLVNPTVDATHSLLKLKTMEKKEKDLGPAVNITASLTEPMKWNTLDLPINKVNIFIGTNGSGKSFILKLVWLFGNLASMYLVSKKHGLAFDPIPNTQFMFDNTYTSNNVDGKITLGYQFGNHISVELEKGKVLGVKFSFEDDITECATSVYLSSQTRLMTEHIKYIQFKDIMGIAPGMPTTQSDLNRILKMYRIYDVMFMERLLNTISTIDAKLLAELNKHLTGFDVKIEFTDLKVDYTKGDILYSTDTLTDVSINTLSAGHQSLCTMFIANLTN